MTWLVDQPIYPLREGHLAYDERVGDYLSGWKHITLEDLNTPNTTVTATSAFAGGGLPSFGELHARAQKRKGESK